MQPCQWHPPSALSEREEHIVQRIRRAKLFVFLRSQRHELFDEAFISSIRAMSRSPTLFKADRIMRETCLVLRSKLDFYQAETGYDLTHFTIDWEAETVTCPQGCTSSS